MKSLKKAIALAASAALLRLASLAISGAARLMKHGGASVKRYNVNGFTVLTDRTPTLEELVRREADHARHREQVWMRYGSRYEQ